MGWIYESKYCDYYDNLNDPKLDAVSCWSGGTVFKPTFYSYEVMSDQDETVCRTMRTDLEVLEREG